MRALGTGKSEWKRTLRTKVPAEAKRYASKALSDCTADFEAAERAQRGEPPVVRDAVKLDAGVLAELEADALRLLLARDAEERQPGMIAAISSARRIGNSSRTLCG